MAFHDPSLSEQMEIIVERGLDDQIAAFDAHVLETKTPETFPGVVMAPPEDRSSDFIILSEFAVDPQLRPNKDRVPCSVCSPRKGKFFKRGFLIYHLSSDELRIVGSTCCRLELSQWDERLSDLGRRQRELERRNRVKTYSPSAIRLREHIDPLLSGAETLKGFRGRLRKGCPSLWKALNLQAQFNPDRLVVTKPEMVTELDERTGEPWQVQKEVTKKVAAFAGAEFCARKFSPLAKLKTAQKLLTEFCPSEAEQRLEASMDGSFPDYYSKWRQAERLVAEAQDELDTARRFFASYNLDCLKTWGATYQAPVAFKVFRFAERGAFRFREDGREQFAEFETSEIEQLRTDPLPIFFESAKHAG